MDTAGMVALLHRAALAEHDVTGVLAVHRDPTADRRLSERVDREMRNRIAELGGFGGFAGADGFEDFPAASDFPGMEHDTPDGAGPDGRMSFRLAAIDRYRCEWADSGRVEVCDGVGAWEFTPADPTEPAHVVDPWTDATLFGLFDPSWLLSGYDLTVREPAAAPATAAGRPAYRLCAVPREAAGPGPVPGREAFLDRIEVAVDAETGILLQTAEIYEGRPAKTRELTSLAFGKGKGTATGTTGTGAEWDECDFRPPAGTPVAPERPGDFVIHAPVPARVIAHGVGMGVQYLAWRTAGFLLRRSAHVEESAPDQEPWCDLLPAPEPLEEAPPSRDELAVLLHRGGRSLPLLRAELHHWTDLAAFLRQLRGPREDDTAPPAGFEAELAGFAPPRSHAISRFTLAGLSRYRVEYLRGPLPVADARGARIVSCDGVRRYALHPNRLVTGLPEQVEWSIGSLVDPAWLLSAQLTPHGYVRLGGRRAVAVTAVPRRRSAAGAGRPFRRAELVVDAQSGILLRLTQGEPGEITECRELRGLEAVAAGTSAGDGLFRLAAPPGVRTVESSGGPLGDLGLPAPVRAAVGAATHLASGVALAAILLARRRRPVRGGRSRDQ
ncbi:hypothetical protein ABIA33_000291 [Streptacidiphilus sp. MAP12-16]|uniref:hypothetical protein n=1 Tax=Streptacidiphilus sp. MAP12-16 TaxID=3156300 RepID=UPI003513DBDF